MTGFSERVNKRIFWVASLLALVSQGVFALGFVGLLAYGEKQVELREQLITGMRTSYPWIDSVAWVSNPDWVPQLYEARRYTNKELLLRIYRSQEVAFDRLESKILTNDQKDVFSRYLISWSERVRLCQGFYAQFDQHLTGQCEIYAEEAMPENWLSLYRDRLFTDMYFYLEGGFVEVYGTRKGNLKACNLTPVSVNTVAAQTAFSDRLTHTYARLGIDQSSPELVRNLGIFNPGECKSSTIIKYDRDVSVYFASVPANSQLSKFVNRELRKGISSHYSSYRPTILNACDKKSVLGFADFSRDHCDGEVYHLTSLAYESKNNALSFQAMTTHPYLMFLDYRRFNGHSWTFDQIAYAQNEAVKFSHIADTQWELDKKWRGKVSHFLLPADLDNRYGALRPGIYFKNGHRVNYYREPLDIPNQGHLVGINDREVWSVYDVYEELEQHGFSRRAGIKVPITLAVTGYDRLQVTRYIFNQQYLPYFIENRNGFIDGFVQDLTWGQEWVSCGATNLAKGAVNLLHWSACGIFGWIAEDQNFCGGTDGQVFEYEDVGECSWKQTQQWAFASQVYPDEFEFGQIASWFVPVGTNTLKVFRGQKLAKSSTYVRALSYGTAEALDNTFIELGTAAPGASFDQKLNMAWIPAGLGFVSGALFYPK
ncbi:hypothetical protein [Teredinibacter turnerae]|uniref:hypothetical protein n=1 Tax=Teredinibacter turnerae TaxID=2426 RepID=UPI00036E189C|nr:hypothetical protein [Teredinibacter turnerae]